MTEPAKDEKSSSDDSAQSNDSKGGKKEKSPSKKIKWEKADFSQYLLFRKKVAELATKMGEKYGTAIKCQGICTDCCNQEPKLNPVEYTYIRGLIEQGVLDRPSAFTEGKCALYVNNTCTIDSHRPVSCQVQGLPQWKRVGYTRGFRSVCKQNFTESGALDAVEEGDLLDSERLNTILSKINIDFCHLIGLKEAAQTVPIRHLYDDINFLDAPPNPPKTD